MRRILPFVDALELGTLGERGVFRSAMDSLEAGEQPLRVSIGGWPRSLMTSDFARAR